MTRSPLRKEKWSVNECMPDSAMRYQNYNFWALLNLPNVKQITSSVLHFRFMAKEIKHILSKYLVWNELNSHIYLYVFYVHLQDRIKVGET